MNNDPPSAQDVHEAEGIIRTLTRSALQQIGDVTDLTLVGTAGTLILRCIMEELKAQRCLVSEYGLREGVPVHLNRLLHHGA